MQHNFIWNLLDLKGIILKKIRYKKNFVKIHIELPVREQTCPHCKAKTTKIKDYRTQIIKRTYLYDLKPHYCHTESVDINVSVSTVARLLPSLAISQSTYQKYYV